MEGVVIKLDRERRLKFNVSAARRFKEAYGMPLYQVRLLRSDERVEVLDHDCLVHILLVGFAHEDRKLTADRVAEILDNYLEAEPEDGLRPVYRAVRKAFRASGLFPGMKDEPEPDEEEPGKVPAAPAVVQAAE